MGNKNNSNFRNNFEFINKISKGIFSEIYLYREKQTKQYFAVKVFPLGRIGQNDIKIFQKETKILESINHPNIVKHYFSFEENNNYYIVKEYCENNDLLKYIYSHKEKNEKISEEMIWKVAYQSLDALNYLHVEKNILNKDITPLNILLSKDNNVKISDFELSGIIPIISNVPRTMEVGYVKGGSPFFLSPESFFDKFTFKSDIWSLGVSLYLMAQLEFPFEGENQIILKENIMNKAPKELDKNYSNELNKFIMKMLDKDPIKRPTAKDCMYLIPIAIKNKYEKKNFNTSSIPQEIKEDLNDLYSLNYEFPNLSM